VDSVRTTFRVQFEQRCWSVCLTSRPFDAELEISTDQAHQIIRAQFPALPARRCTLLGRGWDNVAFLVDDALVFRFPRKASAVQLIETEMHVLPQLAAQLPLAVPDPQWIGAPSEDYPWPFLGYEMIVGRSACAIHPTRAERHAAAPVLGAFLNRLHNLRIERLLPDTLDRANFLARMPLIKQRLAHLVFARFIDSADPWLECFQNPVPNELPLEAVPVHGDLYACHLIFDDQARLTGVIDWGDAHQGDRALDLMMVFGFLPADARAAFFAAYGQADERTLAIARMRAVFHGISVAWYGNELEDSALLREGLTAMELVLE
jgi:aminoglycoside phosphotransferase (APT) family kinase protein